MLLGQIPIHHLKDVASGLWNAPLTSILWKLSIKNYHVLSVLFVFPSNGGLWAPALECQTLTQLVIRACSDTICWQEVMTADS
jgi:hypothetical protein